MLSAANHAENSRARCARLGRVSLHARLACIGETRANDVNTGALQSERGKPTKARVDASDQHMALGAIDFDKFARVRQHTLEQVGKKAVVHNGIKNTHA